MRMACDLPDPKAIDKCGFVAIIGKIHTKTYWVHYTKELGGWYGFMETKSLLPLFP